MEDTHNKQTNKHPKFNFLGVHLIDLPPCASPRYTWEHQHDSLPALSLQLGTPLQFAVLHLCRCSHRVYVHDVVVQKLLAVTQSNESSMRALWKQKTTAKFMPFQTPNPEGYGRTCGGTRVVPLRVPEHTYMHIFIMLSVCNEWIYLFISCDGDEGLGRLAAYLVNQHGGWSHPRYSIHFYQQDLRGGKNTQWNSPPTTFRDEPSRVHNSSTFHTSPLRTLTNASMREKPSKPREFAIISMLCLHLCRASSLHNDTGAKDYNNVNAWCFGLGDINQTPTEPKKKKE